MQQVDDLHKTFIASGWLQQKCANFNTENEILVGILLVVFHHALWPFFWKHGTQIRWFAKSWPVSKSQLSKCVANPKQNRQIYQILWSEKFFRYLGRGGLQRQHVCFSGSRSAAARCSCLAGKQRRWLCHKLFLYLSQWSFLSTTSQTAQMNWLLPCICESVAR